MTKAELVLWRIPFVSHITFNLCEWNLKMIHTERSRTWTFTVNTIVNHLAYHAEWEQTLTEFGWILFCGVNKPLRGSGGFCGAYCSLIMKTWFRIKMFVEVSPEKSFVVVFPSHRQESRGLLSTSASTCERIHWWLVSHLSGCFGLWSQYFGKVTGTYE